MFSLASDALSEQERHVSEIRTRASTLLAAATVIVSILARAIFHGDHPHGTAEAACVFVGIGSGVLLVACVADIFLPRALGFSVDATATYAELFNDGLLEQPATDLALADALATRRRENAKTIRRLARGLSIAVVALIWEIAGLALAAALASS